MTAATCEEPSTFKEAMRSPDSELWKVAIREEMDSLNSHNTWDVVRLPANSGTISTKSVFRKKLRQDGTIGRDKARLVVRGFMQG